jgi:hypothetical protein
LKAQTRKLIKLAAEETQSICSEHFKGTAVAKVESLLLGMVSEILEIENGEPAAEPSPAPEPAPAPAT